MYIFKSKIDKPQEKSRFGLSLLHNEKKALNLKGEAFIKMTDSETGETLFDLHKPNIITKDSGILIARLLRDSEYPNAGRSNGLTMLAVGTGATGSLLSPDVPQRTQRKLNTEVDRKVFSSIQYRNSLGQAVNYETNIIDFTATFSSSEAVGPLNEMGLLATYSLNPNESNSVNNGPTNYDSTLDISEKDVLFNYLTFPVISKTNTAVLSITWRLTFGS
jgi:hypothetical protein